MGFSPPVIPKAFFAYAFGSKSCRGREPGAHGLDVPKPGQRKRRDTLLGRVPREHVPVAVIRQQVVGAQCVLRDTPVKGLVRDPDLLAAFDEARDLRPDFRIDPDAVLGHDPDMFSPAAIARRTALDRDVALQRLGDLIQDGPHVEVQRRTFVMGQKLAGEAEAEGLLAADAYRRERVGSSVSRNPRASPSEGEGGCRASS